MNKKKEIFKKSIKILNQIKKRIRKKQKRGEEEKEKEKRTT